MRPIAFIEPYAGFLRLLEMEYEPTTIPDPEAGATAEFPFDRATVERFRQAFPRARWSDSRKAWFVPGRTASKRISSWLARIEADADAFADEKGRDAYAFDPLSSPYLEANSDGLRIRTPFSRTVVSELREVPLSRWDGDMRVWHVPYRSIDDLRRRWPDIEAAAHRNEPAVKKERLKVGRVVRRLSLRAHEPRSDKRRGTLFPPAISRPWIGRLPPRSV